MHRQTMQVVGVVLLVSFAGCSFLSGPLEFSANKATVLEATQGDTGYEEVNVTEHTIEREFNRAGVSKQVKVTNWQAMYERKVDLGPLGTQKAAVFSVFSTPKVEIAGQGPFNPVGEYSNSRLVKLVQQQYDGMNGVEKVSERQVSMLGQTTTVSKFSATATLGGSGEIEVFVHIAKVSHGDDYVIAIAVYPQQLPNEQSRVDALFQNIEHESG